MRPDRHTEPLRWLTHVTVALSYFAMQSTMTSVPPILPTLAHIFEADVSQVSWAMTASFLTVGISGHA
jgi:predicted MFS family arabinose efflux permease